jgi:hypothetical protein
VLAELHDKVGRLHWVGSLGSLARPAIISGSPYTSSGTDAGR